MVAICMCASVCVSAIDAPIWKGVCVVLHVAFLFSFFWWISIVRKYTGTSCCFVEVNVTVVECVKECKHALYYCQFRMHAS